MWELDEKKAEKAILIAVAHKGQSDSKTTEHLDELEFLAQTLEINSLCKVIQKLERPDIRTFVGRGKLEEVKTMIKVDEIDTLIFDDELSPSQLRNLEKETKIKIYDRSLLILDIFLKRAKTAQAKTQVEVARYEYLLPRLTRMWTHLERQRGGTGTRGGAGEKEIETDRRMIRNQISILKKKLEKIDRQNATQRKSRSGIVRVALVGYTNVGKSTIMKTLSKSDIYAKDELFATVDSTVRKVVINQIPFLLSDTVGFIRKLPHSLIESFKSTLDEVREADVLLHVVDISHPAYQDHVKTVNNTLVEIGASNKPTVMVYNKMDQLDEETRQDLGIDNISGNNNGRKVFMSAKNNENLEALKKNVVELVTGLHIKIYPNYINGHTYAY